MLVNTPKQLVCYTVYEYDPAICSPILQQGSRSHVLKEEEEDSAIEGELPSPRASPPLPSSPLSEATVRNKFSFSVDDDASQMTEMGSNKSNSCSSDEVMDIAPLLSPTEEEEGRKEEVLPLFLRVVYRVRQEKTQEGEEGEVACEGKKEKEEGSTRVATIEKAELPLCLSKLHSFAAFTCIIERASISLFGTCSTIAIACKWSFV